ncbi:MAG: DUF3108 domain-containing protein [Gallionellaceae bacterium]|nr:DUF3108 domain-containing protein [Gallionellaceae bacterium]
MRILINLSLTLLLCAIAPSLLAVESPNRIHAKYDVLKGNIKIATITETYTRTPGGYHIESVSRAVGLLAVFKPEIITITSEGTLTTHGLRPTTFIQKRKLDGHRNARADFDWNAHLITLTDRAGTRTLPLATATQDRLSVMYQFIFSDLSNIPLLNLKISNGSKVDDYSYRITPNQNVKVPLGIFPAIYLTTPRQGKEKNQTEIWLATEHANFPYKMTITDSDGDALTQELTQFNFEP